MPYSEPIPVEDATRIDDDGTYCDVLLAAASRGIARRTGDELPKVIAGLYDCGYALVKVLPDPIEWRDTETGWRESTDGEWATAYAEGEGPDDCPVCEITDPHAHALRPGGSVDPTRTLSLTEAVQ